MSAEFDKDMWLIALCAWNNVPCDSAAMAKYSDENWGKLSVEGWKRVATALEQEITRHNQSTILQPMQKTEELLDIIGKFWTGEYYPGHEEAAERITSVSSAKQPDVNQELLEALKELGPFELVHGDTIQRTNPHSRQMLNSSESWAVSVGNRSALRVRNAIECINKFIASANQKVCPDCGGGE